MSEDILYRPSPEHIVTTNAWAFLHRTRRLSGGWAGLLRWSVEQPDAFAAAMAEFAGGAKADAVALANTLLHADLRPDDRVLLADAWPLPKPPDTVFVAADAPESLHRELAKATVLVVSADRISAFAGAHPEPWPMPSRLRLVLALGGPMGPDARAGVYAWIKADVPLLAQAGASLWGSPIEPVPRVAGAPVRFCGAPDAPIPAAAGCGK